MQAKSSTAPVPPITWPCIDFVDEIINQLADDPEVGVLVLGAGTDKKSGPGPLVTQLSRNAGSLPVPITIVPGDMSKERLEMIT